MSTLATHETKGLATNGKSAYPDAQSARDRPALSRGDAGPTERVPLAKRDQARDLLDRAFAAVGAIVELDPSDPSTFRMRPFPGQAARARYERESSAFLAQLAELADDVVALLKADARTDVPTPQASAPKRTRAAEARALRDEVLGLAAELATAAGPDEALSDSFEAKLASLIGAKETRTLNLITGTAQHLLAKTITPPTLATVLDEVTRLKMPARPGAFAGQVAPLMREAHKERTALKVVSKPTRTAVLQCFASIKPERYKWLWPGRVALGGPTIFSGDPKLGKSFVTLWLAAQVSRGIVPGSSRQTSPGSVIILSAEDSAARTIRPRLEAAGADLDRVHTIRSIMLEDGTSMMPSLRTDLDAIEDAIVSLRDVRLVVIDPVSAYLGGIDEHRGGEVRGLLNPLADLAERLDVAFVMVNHLTKSTSTNAKYRVGASISFVGAARSVFLFVRDPAAAQTKRVLMLSAGTNLAEDAPPIAYKIVGGSPAPTVQWDPTRIEMTAEEALADTGGDDLARSDRDDLDNGLRRLLEDGPVEAEFIYTRLGKLGYSIYQIKRSKARLGIKSTHRSNGIGFRWVWFRPDRAKAKRTDNPTGTEQP